MRQTRGDLFSKKADFVCITTNGTVNAKGEAVMGRGVALQASKTYPGLAKWFGGMLKDYGNHVMPLMRISNSSRLVSFPVKYHWRDDADFDLIERSAIELAQLVLLEHDMRVPALRDRTRIVLPRPGCGNGRLDWDDVRPVIEPHLDDRFWIVWNGE